MPVSRISISLLVSHISSRALPRNAVLSRDGGKQGSAKFHVHHNCHKRYPRYLLDVLWTLSMQYKYLSLWGKHDGFRFHSPIMFIFCCYFTGPLKHLSNDLNFFWYSLSINLNKTSSQFSDAMQQIRSNCSPFVL